jgi:hypothetical protein
MKQAHFLSSVLKFIVESSYSFISGRVAIKSVQYSCSQR